MGLSRRWSLALIKLAPVSFASGTDPSVLHLESPFTLAEAASNAHADVAIGHCLGLEGHSFDASTGRAERREQPVAGVHNTDMNRCKRDAVSGWCN